MELAEEACRRLGYAPEFRRIAWEQKDALLQSGEIDCLWGCFTMTGREDDYTWVGPYVNNSIMFVVTADSGITGKADLEGKKVSVQTGTTAEEYCMGNGYEVLAFTANNDAAAALTSGKVDAWVVDNEVALAMAPELGLTVLDEAMTSEPYAFAFQKGSELVTPFNEALDALLSDGAVEQIFQQYGVTYIAP